jgi:PST family polysaccharide transporter
VNARRAVGSLLARHILGFAINFLGTIVLVRHFGPEVWGVYSVAYSVQFIAQGIIERGTSGYLIQRQAPPSEREIGTALTMQLVLGVAAAAIAAAAAPAAASFFGSTSLTPLLFAVAVSLVAYALRAVPFGMLERSISYRRVGALEVADVVVFNAVAILGVVAGLEVGALVLAIASRAIVSLALAWPLAGVAPVPRLSITALRELLGFAAPYAASNALAYVNGAAAPLLVVRFAGPRSFGILQLAYSLIAYPQALNAILGRVAFPVYSRMEQDQERVRRSVEEATRMLIRYVGTATLALAASGPLWVPLVYGPEWVGMAPIMLTIAPSLAIGTSFTFVIASLNATGRARAVLAVGAAFSAIYWLGAALLVPSAGAIGLPLAYSFATIAFALYLELFRRTVGPIGLRLALGDLAVAAAGLLAAAWLYSADAAAGALVPLLLLVYWPLRHIEPRRLAREVPQLLSAMVSRQ